MSRFEALIRPAKRWLYFLHRWTGIILCLLFSVWFISGVVMMYVPFPSFRMPERVAHAPRIPWERVKVAPGAVLDRLGLAEKPAVDGRKRMRPASSLRRPHQRDYEQPHRQRSDLQAGNQLESVLAHMSL